MSYASRNEHLTSAEGGQGQASCNFAKDQAGPDVSVTTKAGHGIAHVAASVPADLQEVRAGDVVLGDRDGEVQVEHRVPPAARHIHRLAGTLTAGSIGVMARRQVQVPD